MKSKLIIGSLSAALLLAACGHDDNNSGPAKINEGKKGTDNKTEQKKNNDGKSHKENKSDIKQNDKNKSVKNEDGNSDKEYTNKRPDEYNGSLVNTKNDAKNLPKNLQKDLDIKETLVNYTDLKGKQGINDLIEKNTIQNPNKIANKNIHDKVWNILNNSYNNTLKFVKDNSVKNKSGIDTKTVNAREKLVNDNYYGEDDKVNYMITAATNDWRLDKKSLKVTEYGDDNTYQFQVNLVDKKGKQMGVVSGEAYDVVNQITIDDFYGSDEGLHQAVIKDSQIQQGKSQPNKYK